ncbi:MAG: hypothetical protein U9Q75_03590 [Pseudomonadota bacterium]|nr:hypothetical protein [Pseudomonadota bacterium]
MKRRTFIHSIGVGALLGIYSQNKSILATTDAISLPGGSPETAHIAKESIESELAKRYTFKQFVEGKSTRSSCRTSHFKQ